MTQAELTFFEMVPRALRDIASELHKLNENKPAQVEKEPETKETPAMKDYGKPYWDENRKAVFVPIINKFLDAKDLCDGEKNWNDAMELAKQNGKELPSRKEMLILAYFVDEINAILEENGGEKLEGWYWASTELSFNNAWSMYFSNGGLYYYYKSNANSVRAVAAI